MADVIKIPITSPAYTEGKEFYNDNIATALSNTQKEGYRAMFMPELIDARISSPGDSRLWQAWWTTPSIRATGRSRQGTPVVVYAHVDNYFSNPENIRTAIKNGLIGGVGIMPDDEFYRLLDMGDNQNVYVVDYKVLKCSESGLIPVKEAMKHPQTIPFIGGEQRAEQYLKQHRENYGSQIGIWHSDDLREKPVGRFLFLGDLCLYGNDNLGSGGRFLGVHPEVVVGGAQKAPRLEQILKD